MKALSLWQPWATLVAIGAKQWETRGWSTSYRGPLLICAAKRPMDLATRGIVKLSPFRDVLADVVLPFGAALCVVNLRDVEPAEDVAPRLSWNEFHFGNYAPGRFAWRLDCLRPLPEPIPIVGRQGLFNVPADIADKVMEMLP